MAASIQKTHSSRGQRKSDRHPLPTVLQPSQISPTTRRRGWILFVVLFPLFFLAILYLGSTDFILDWLMVYETPQQEVDAVLVDGLGGNLETAIQLYREGKTKFLLITQAVPEKYRNVEEPISLHHFIRNKLLESGIPEPAFDSLPQTAHTMLERQLMIRKWMLDHECHSYLVFSGRYSSRLKKMQHDDTFPQGDITLVIYPSEGKKVWRKEWMGIQNTLIRMSYWALVYREQIRGHNE